jgi:hypothetical protein
VHGASGHRGSLGQIVSGVSIVSHTLTLLTIVSAPSGRGVGIDPRRAEGQCGGVSVAFHWQLKALEIGQVYIAHVTPHLNCKVERSHR